MGNKQTKPYFCSALSSYLYAVSSASSQLTQHLGGKPWGFRVTSLLETRHGLPRGPATGCSGPSYHLMLRPELAFSTAW